MTTTRALIAVSFLALLGAVDARAADVPTVESALTANQGKRVTLRLSAGEEMTGKVSAVSDDSVHLSELAGREFFDAVVALDDVVAVVYRAREK